MLIQIQSPSHQIQAPWHQYYSTIEKLKPKLNIKTVTWIRPEHSIYKLNTDGCCKGNPGNGGGGGILRNSQGNMIMACTDFYGMCTNNLAESKAILTGLQWCASNGYRHVTIESDSQMIIGMINGITETPWMIKDLKIQHFE